MYFLLCFLVLIGGMKGGKMDMMKSILMIGQSNMAGETVRKPLRGDNRILNVGLSPKQS